MWRFCHNILQQIIICYLSVQPQFLLNKTVINKIETDPESNKLFEITQFMCREKLNLFVENSSETNNF